MARHIAQINVASALYPLDDPRMDEFTARLDDVNALADRSPGFVWRLQTDSGNSTDVQVSDDPRLLVNMSVWEDIESLFEFAYRSAHTSVMARRKEWFEMPSGAYQALWWIEAGSIPTVEEGMERLRRLAEVGPTAEAFTFKKRFPPPDGSGCPGGPHASNP